MNGTQGIVPTIDLATNNGNGLYPYPVMYGNCGFGGNGMFGGDAIWLIVLLALIWNGNNGNGGLLGGGRNFDDGYAWLSNGQKEIMANTNSDFNSLHLSNQLEGNRDALNGISNQICNSTASVTQAVTTGFANAEASESARQIANMQQAFNNQLFTQQSFNGLERQLCDCCADNRLATANLNSTILAENCADREALSNGIRDIITSQNNGVERILQQLCSDKIDQKNEKIADLQREILMKDLQASQVSQTEQIRIGQNNAVNSLVNELRSCPIPAQPVYGNTPIFQCDGYNRCGCGNYYGANIM